MLVFDVWLKQNSCFILYFIYFLREMYPYTHVDTTRAAQTNVVIISFEGKVYFGKKKTIILIFYNKTTHVIMIVFCCHVFSKTLSH